MATRTTPAKVREILQTEEDELVIQPHVDAANVFVTQMLGSAGLSAALMAEIERWVAAHFFVAFEPLPQSENIGGASRSIQVEKLEGIGLKTSVYGQRACLLDPTGTLGAGTGGRPAKVETLDLSLSDNF